jgi:hypothetical protein
VKVIVSVCETLIVCGGSRSGSGGDGGFNCRLNFNIFPLRQPSRSRITMEHTKMAIISTGRRTHFSVVSLYEQIYNVAIDRKVETNKDGEGWNRPVGSHSSAAAGSFFISKISDCTNYFFFDFASEWDSRPCGTKWLNVSDSFQFYSGVQHLPALTCVQWPIRMLHSTGKKNENLKFLFCVCALQCINYSTSAIIRWGYPHG